MMPDRKEVIAALTACAGNEKKMQCNICPYRGKENRIFCLTPLLHDTLTLMKEQEPKMVVITTSTIRCPGCGKQITSKGAIHKDIKYCWKCGQAVKWDG